MEKALGHENRFWDSPTLNSSVACRFSALIVLASVDSMFLSDLQEMSLVNVSQQLVEIRRKRKGKSL
jgi:hypothetical protein